MSTYTLRPSNSDKEAFRIKLTSASLLGLKLRPGDLCTLHLSDDDNDDRDDRVAIAWDSSGNGMKDGIVQTSKSLQELYGLKLGQKVTIRRCVAKLQDAEAVVLRPVNEGELSVDERARWSLAASMTVPGKHDVLAPGMEIVVNVGPHRMGFKVGSVGGSIARVTERTVFKFDDGGVVNGLRKELQLGFDRMGGIQSQTDQLRRFVKNLTNSWAQKNWSRFRQRQGVLLYGAKGTGKSMLQETVAQNEWARVVRWSPGTKVAASVEPQLVLVEFNRLSNDMKSTLELLAVFEAVKKSCTLILGSVRHPNDVSEMLRSPQTFSTELELPVPDAEQRYDILRVLRDDSAKLSDAQILDIATRTHGFVGADLDALLHEVFIAAGERIDSIHQEPNGTSEADGTSKPSDEDSTIQSRDIEYALSRVRPSALQEIFLEKPNVRWTDIGGQHDIKRQLQNAVERPLKYPERMKSLGLQPKKGVLLYGPPGCSKTLTVKALATEAGLNFLAVKGAELVSMYVGESEKATREVFRKARQASPAIIFFDEIDAIARRGRSGSDLNVLTTLLNEMDGFEELKNVMVVAATNKPQEIDPALLRPGRFDNVVYIGPPDLATRKEIFDKRFSGISVDPAVVSSTERFARMTDGFSGAEVVAICQAAGESAFDHDRDFVAEGDVIAAIAGTPKGISREMLDEYQAWNSARTKS